MRCHRSEVTAHEAISNISLATRRLDKRRGRNWTPYRNKATSCCTRCLRKRRRSLCSMIPDLADSICTIVVVGRELAEGYCLILGFTAEYSKSVRKFTAT